MLVTLQVSSETADNFVMDVTKEELQAIEKFIKEINLNSQNVSAKVMQQEIKKEPKKAKLYNVHVGMRYTSDVLVEAETAEEAQRIIENNLDYIDIVDMEFASDDYDVWEEDPDKFSKYYVMVEDGSYVQRNNYNLKGAV